MPAPCFAAPDQTARDLTLVSADDLPRFLEGQPKPVQAWLTGSGFEAGLGEVRLLPGADGAVGGAVAGLGTAKARARLRFGVAKALAGLPGGAWRLAGQIDRGGTARGGAGLAAAAVPL